MKRHSRSLSLLCVFLLFEVAASAQTDWTEIAPLPTPRAFPAAAVLNGQIYVIGGRSGSGVALDVVERYDPNSNTWTTIDATRDGRFNASAATFNGQILLTGGRSEGVLTNDVDVYDPIDARWESFDHLQDEREGHETFVAGDDVYVFGGLTESGQYRDDAEVYNESNGSWDDYGFWVLDTPRAAFATAPTSSGVLVYGGFNSLGPVAEVEHYVPNQGGITRASLPEPRGALAGTGGLGRVYAIGGRNASQDVLGRVDIYTISLDQWDPGPQLPEPREGAVAATVDETIYVFGGQDDSGDLILTSVSLDLVTANEPAVPDRAFALVLSGANPFNLSTSFSLTADGVDNVNVAVYDILGRQLALLYSGPGSLSTRELTWDGMDSTGQAVSNGVYFVRATNGLQSTIQIVTRVR